MKCATLLILLCLVAADLVLAYPLSLKSTGGKALNDATDRKDQRRAQEAVWGVIAQLFQDQVREEATRGNAEVEGLTSFFNNLKNKFQEFGNRMRHAFNPSGK